MVTAVSKFPLLFFEGGVAELKKLIWSKNYDSQPGWLQMIVHHHLPKGCILAVSKWQNNGQPA